MLSFIPWRLMMSAMLLASLTSFHQSSMGGFDAVSDARPNKSEIPRAVMVFQLQRLETTSF